MARTPEEQKQLDELADWMIEEHIIWMNERLNRLAEMIWKK